MKVGEKYIIKKRYKQIKNKKCEIVKIVNKETVIVGFNNAYGWSDEQLREKTGYKFFWAVGVEYLEHENFLEIE
jgi:hypothetical protein